MALKGLRLRLEVSVYWDLGRRPVTVDDPALDNCRANWTALGLFAYGADIFFQLALCLTDCCGELGLSRLKQPTTLDMREKISPPSL